MRYLIEHTTRLQFATPVREHHFELRLAPRAGAELRTLRCELRVAPEATLREHLDCFGNRVHRGSLMEPHEGLAAELVAEVETRLDNPFAYHPLAPREERSWLERRLAEEPDLHAYLQHRSEAVPDLDATPGLESPLYESTRTLLENVQDAMAWAGERFAYAPATTAVHAPLAELVERKAGVCQDFTHLLVALVRGWGFPARYVSGYVDPGAASDERAEPREEATHAWAEVLIPAAGWRGFDATVGLVANELYVPVAVGRDSRDAAPIRGTYKGDAQEVPPEVRLRVARQAGQQ